MGEDFHEQGVWNARAAQWRTRAARAGGIAVLKTVIWVRVDGEKLIELSEPKKDIAEAVFDVLPDPDE
jgi:hypothetical protein